MGDEALVAVARIAMEVFRQTDVVGRWGGEELLVLFTDSEPEVTLRLVLDQRRSNCRWRSPPWCALGGVNAMSFLDVSEEMEEEGV